MTTIQLQAEPLTRESFAPFGDVIESEDAKHFPINQGGIERFHDLAQVDIGVEQGGRPLISLGSANRTTALPCRVEIVERHPLGTQAFIPMSATPMIVVVGPPGEVVDPGQLRAFVSNGNQGVNYHRGVWHMPLIALEPEQRFVIVDRGGAGDNCEERVLDREVFVSL